MLKRLFISILCCALFAQPLLAQNNYAAGACSLIPESKTCIDSTPCKLTNTGDTVCLSNAAIKPHGAFTVPLTCWQYSHSFACSAINAVNTCGELEKSPACGLINSKCTDKSFDGATCTEYQQTFSCKTTEAVTEKRTVCGDSAITALKLPTPTNTNNTFSRAAIAQEIASEAQQYSKNGQDVFMGVRETCSLGYAGLKDCCKSATGAKANSVMANVVMGTAGGVIKYAGELAVDAASPYMYDAMFTVGEWTGNFDMQLEAAMGSTNAAASGFSAGAYGFTYTTTAVEAGSGLMGATSELAGSAEMGYINFNPYVFAAYLAVAYLQSVTACSSEEQMLMMHRGANLSFQTGEFCSKTIPIIGTCIETTRTFCSFNSVLSRIVNSQGKPQLGKDINDCTGLTFDELTKLDFGKIDFSEFASTMTDQATKFQPKNINKTYTPIMQTTTKGAGQTANSGLAYPTKAP
jgi:conjugal transfer mating pair stabilization protein TraN